MIITRATVAERLLAYLNRHLTLAQLVDWAETTVVDADLEPDSDIAMLNGILGYLAAADTSSFPLTWEKCSAFLAQLGVLVEVNVRHTA